ncbi:MAG: type III pantothenate kinase [Clostridia bacterium]|nr:type III pantothenate kinase [Clostridia bacterium]
MIFTMDVGNTNIKMGLFKGNELIHYWRLATSLTRTSDEYGIAVTSLFESSGLSRDQVTGIMISSVVPPVNFTIEHMCNDYFGITPKFVLPGIKTGVNIHYDNPQALGSDRICNAVAACEYYGCPCIFIDFGTATTFGVVDEKGAFAGGCICPGIKIASDALVRGTAKLPNFELIKPDTVIGRNTITNLQSGIIFGYVGQVEYLIKKMKKELGREDTVVVATGGMARMIAAETKAIDKIDGRLTLKGLRLIYERNIGA